MADRNGTTNIDQSGRQNPSYFRSEGAIQAFLNKCRRDAEKKSEEKDKKIMNYRLWRKYFAASE